MVSFLGFSTNTLSYLTGLEANNTREWFTAHKSDYQTHLLAPFVALATDLAPVLAAIDPAIETGAAVGKALSRMNRDVRFSRDKSPYRSCMWLGYKRPGKEWTERPAFFFELAPAEYRFGMGMYLAGKPFMDRFRAFIADKPDRFRREIAFLKDNPFFEVHGESYKRPMAKDLPDDLKSWAQWKSFYLVCNRDNDDSLYSPDFAKTLADAFNLAAPFYRFLWELAGTVEETGRG